ncbi:MAG: cbb3-type cytochrome c oxidase subunit I [Candidatus Doudnabacteria bacterium]|nr:cbb3-type cytochrome c oxidase subunit I [Candidatus Doudnabacteria bacterium]
MFGKLTWAALPHEWYTLGAAISIAFGGLFTAIIFTKFKMWGTVWEWCTSTDPKKIGIIYIIVAMLMLFRGFLDAAMLWIHQAFLNGTAMGLSSDHFQEIFTAHGVIMVVFVTMGLMFGLMNYIIPIQIGARDVAFPFLNTLSLWLYIAGVVFINLFFIFGGDFSSAGWLAYPPLSGLEYSPGVGVDYWIWSLQISGLGTLLGGINILVTILKMRAPGMTMMKLPMFSWATLYSMVLILAAFPLLTATLVLLSLDRTIGTHFFTSNLGGNPMMYVNLIWMWGHPEVYIIMLPSFGIYAQVVSTFSRKKLFGYTSTVVSLFLITLFSMLVWLHHFFTMGAGANVNAFFGIMTMIIAIPTGIIAFNSIMTMYQGRITISTPMLWFLGFIATFTFGGMAGVMMSVPAADFQVHNSLFLVAHFHTMAIGGALFGIFAGFSFWFVKITGIKLNKRIGKYAFWCWLIGFFVSFVPLYILGFMGAGRRLDQYDPATGWQWLFMVSATGLSIIALGSLLQVIQIIVSIRQRNRDLTGNPWEAKTLEWATSSPPPFYNFAILPKVIDRDQFTFEGNIQSFHMPKNTPIGIYISGLVFLVGFGMVWHMWWLAVVGAIGSIVCVIARSMDDETEYELSVEEIKKIENESRSR